MRKANFYQKSGATFAFNPWDLLALILMLSLLAIFAYGATQMSRPFDVGQQVAISLHPAQLPFYGLQSVLRMLMAMLLSLMVTFLFGAWAAKSKHAERIIIPAVDILQSVPVLGYLSITVTAFIALFPGSLWGPEFCCIFVIFTAQVWNMLLGFYQSLKTVPHNLIEASRMFNLTPWQRFWRVEVPFAMPNLLWNMMMSMSQSWVYLMFNEAIQVAKQNIQLPGIGSYIFNAIKQGNVSAIVYAIIAMFVIIFLYDQIMFRPLISWAEKFKIDQDVEQKPTRTWFTNLLQKSQLSKYIGAAVRTFTNAVINFRVNKTVYQERRSVKTSLIRTLLSWVFYGIVVVVLVTSFVVFIHYIFSTLGWRDFFQVVGLTAATTLRVVATIIICSVIWVPVGVWIGRNKRLSKLAQPIVQFCAAFPVNLIYPLKIGRAHV